MIFVTVGSQKFPFDRLLAAVDRLVEEGVITEDVFAQTGASGYLPQNYRYKPFCSPKEFAERMAACDTVISHGGTGTIIKAVREGKKVIAVPRLARYGEHVDDHQLQLLRQFEELDLICVCTDVARLPEALETVRGHQYASYRSNTEAFLASLEDYIRTLGEERQKTGRRKRG